MSFSAPSTFQLASVLFLLAGSLLQAQFSDSSAEPIACLSAVAKSDVMSAENGVSSEGPTLAAMGNGSQAIEAVLTGVLEHYRSSGNRKGEANTLFALGNSYNSLGQQQKAIEQFQQALAIYRAIGDEQRQADALSRMGDVYHGWGFPELAVRSYRSALQLQVEIDDKPGKAMVLNNLGVMYLALSNKKKALDYLDQARTAYHDEGDGHGEILTLINMGAAENFLAHDARKAITLLQQAIGELEPLHDRTNLADAYDLLGVVWAGLHKSERAEINFGRALDLYRALGDAHGEARVLRHLRALGESPDLASAR